MWIFRNDCGVVVGACIAGLALPVAQRGAVDAGLYGWHTVWQMGKHGGNRCASWYEYKKKGGHAVARRPTSMSHRRHLEK